MTQQPAVLKKKKKNGKEKIKPKAVSLRRPRAPPESPNPLRRTRGDWLDLILQVEPQFLHSLTPAIKSGVDGKGGWKGCE